MPAPGLLPPYVRKRVSASLTYLALSAILVAVAAGLYRGGVHIAGLRPESITLTELPYALALSFSRMAVSYAASLVFAFVIGILAGTTRAGERILIPSLDILQSVPIVAFFPAAIGFFVQATDGHRMGVELAAGFLIFTSQAWNLAFAVFEAIKTVPSESIDAVRSLGVAGGLKFWKLYAPAAIPRLVFNSILSWSNGWYFLVACEIFAVGPMRFHLPGIGSFLARAAEEDQLGMVGWGLAALTGLVLAMDWLVWRPAARWSDRFKQESTGSENARGFGIAASRIPFVFARGASMPGVEGVRRAARRLIRVVFHPVSWFLREVVTPLVWDLPSALVAGLWGRSASIRAPFARELESLLPVGSIQRRGFVTIAFGALIGWLAIRMAGALGPPWPPGAEKIPAAILLSTARIAVAMGLSLLWVLPVVYLVWRRPRARGALTTLAQVGAALPAVALFPLIVVVAVRRLGGGIEISAILLLITGMQWYLLFNCLGGAAVVPSDLTEAARAFGLGGAATWRRIVLPAIQPALITGAITAWGGGWNALVVSEYVQFQGRALSVNGIGALINRAIYESGDMRMVGLCVASMLAWILVVNSLVWRPIYRFAVERYRIDS